MSEATKAKVQEAGVCPVCGYEGLQFGDEGMEIAGDRVFYRCECVKPEGCGWSGREWYTLEFEEFTEDRGEGAKPKG